MISSKQAKAENQHTLNRSPTLIDSCQNNPFRRDIEMITNERHVPLSVLNWNEPGISSDPWNFLGHDFISLGCTYSFQLVALWTRLVL
jgi:hypothetical protein